LPATISASAPFCAGSTITLTDGTTGGTWSSGTTTVATVTSATGVVMGVLSGTSTINYLLGTGCSAAVVITVNTTPSAIPASSPVCVGSAITLTDGITGGAWASGNTAIATIVSGTGDVTGVSSGTAVITYELSTGCIATTVVTVNTLPQVISGSGSVCAGSTITLADLTTGGTWSAGSTTIATVISGSGVVTGVASGTSIITYTLGSGCRTTTVVTVNPLPLAISAAGSVCAGSTATLGDLTTGGTWTSGNTTVATVAAGTGIATGVGPGTATITYTISTGCSTITVVTVNPLPNLITGGAVVCTGSTRLLADVTTGGTWSSSATGIATIASTGVVTGVVAGTATITYTVSTGCSVTSLITDTDPPLAITGATVVCSGSTMGLADATSGGTWSSSTTTTATISSGGLVTGVGSGTTAISYTLGTGCLVTSHLTVDPLPSAITGGATVCVGSTRLLADVTTGGAWSSSSAGTATVASSGMVSGVSAGTATITYALSTGCYVVAPLTVNPLPSVITGGSAVCIGGTNTLADVTTGGTWSSTATGIGTVNGSGTVSGVAIGSTTISYTLATGCSVTSQITVDPLPAAITGSASVCTGLSTTLLDVTSGGTWSSSNSSAASVGSLTGSVAAGVSPGTATITYTIASGCSATVVVTVNSVPASISGSGTVCIGSTIALSDLGTGTWSSGNTSVATVVTATGNVTGVAPGTASITYSVASGCSAASVITVNPLPPSIGGASSVCAGSTVTLTDGTTGGIWTSNNTATATVNSTSGSVSGIAAGTVTMSYTALTGCIVTKALTVNPLPSLITGSVSVCAGATITLGDLSTAGTWSTNNTTIASVALSSGVVTGFVPGTSTITYTLGTSCTATTIVTVNITPVAIFGLSAVCPGSSITLSDATSGGSWSTASTTVTVDPASGNVSGISSGTAAITYTVGSCAATRLVTVSPVAAVTGVTSLCQGSSASLTPGLGGGSWSSSNTGVATVNAALGVVTGVSSGTAAITYTLTTGCTTIAPITVNPLPATISGVTHVCQGATTALSDAATGGTWSSSSSTAASINSATGVVTGVAPGTATVSYSLVSGCITTTSVTVNAIPGAITGTTSVCQGLTTTLTDGGTGVWGSSNTSVAIVIPGTDSVIGVTPGTATISFTFTSGCAAIAIVTVNITPASITGAPAVCAGTSVSLTDATSGGTWSTTATVATVDGSGNVSGTSAGVANITYAIGSCAAAMAITVNPVAPVTGAGGVCAASTIALADAVTGGTWSSGSTAIATVGVSSGTVTGVTPGTAAITYTSPAGCTSAAAVTINALPAPITGTSAVCAGATGTLLDAATGGTWYSSNTAIATINSASGSFAGAAAGTASVTYTNSNGCTSATTVTVNPLPSPITAAATSVCAGSPLTLSDPGSGTWSSSNTAIATIDGTGLLSALSAGSVTITYALSTGCTAIAGIVVNPLPAAITGDGFVCIAGTVVLSNTGAGTWSSSDETIATIDASGTVSGIATGTATITFTISTGCFSTVTETVTACPGSGVSQITSALGNITIVPNPNKGEFTINGVLNTATDEEVSLEIVDMLGQVIYKDIVTAHSGNITEHIKLSAGIANGMYLLNLRMASENRVFHIVVEQ